MRSTIIFKTSKGNLYLYDFQKKEMKPCHPLIYVCSLLDKNKNDEILFKELKEKKQTKYSDREIDYYYCKYLHYKKIGYFSDIFKEPFVKNDSKDVIESVSNVKNIVFEVTDSCNLHCKYCAYGDLYNDYDSRKDKKMSFETVKAVLDYLLLFWKSNTNKSAMQIISIGFYGGEPLMNFDLIRRTVEYCNDMDISTRKFQFTMTTNATLLDKYLDYLVENEFNITISLDGNEWGNSYRVYHNGMNSFDKVFSNVKKIKDAYPNFFAKNVSFNSVLHNRNSVESTHQFIYEQFGKIPEIHPMNTSGIMKEKMNQFKEMFVTNSESSITKDTRQTRFTSDSKIFSLCQFLLWYGNNQFFDYESFVYRKDTCQYAHTGTCFPFSRKMYITVNNKILPCEKISSIYVLGYVVNGKVNLDAEEIAQKYNDFYSRMYIQCKECYMINGCSQCIFQLELNDKFPVCHGFCSEDGICNNIKGFVDMLECRDIKMEKLLNDVYLS